VHSPELFDNAQAQLRPLWAAGDDSQTVSDAGRVTSRHLCQEHGELRVIEEYYYGLTEAERQHIARAYRLARRGT